MTTGSVPGAEPTNPGPQHLLYHTVPDDGVLVARHLLDQRLRALLLPVHDQRQAQRHAPDDLRPRLQRVSGHNSDQSLCATTRSQQAMAMSREWWPAGLAALPHSAQATLTAHCWGAPAELHAPMMTQTSRSRAGLRASSVHPLRTCSSRHAHLRLLEGAHRAHWSTRPPCCDCTLGHLRQLHPHLRPLKRQLGPRAFSCWVSCA